MKTINEISKETREYLLSVLDFGDGEILDFVPCTEADQTGMTALEVKFVHGIHFVWYQTIWNSSYYATRNGEQISHKYYVGRIDKNTHIYLQGFIDDLISGRFDNAETPTEKYLKYIEENNLTSYMNNTRWNQLFEIIHQIESETGHEVQINYKLLGEDEEKWYWTISGDEELPGINSRYFQWFKIKPIYVKRIYKGRLMDDEYIREDYTNLFLEKINKTNLRYEPVNDDGAFIIYGYR